MISIVQESQLKARTENDRKATWSKNFYSQYIPLFSHFKELYSQNYTACKLKEKLKSSSSPPLYKDRN